MGIPIFQGNIGWTFCPFGCFPDFLCATTIGIERKDLSVLAYHLTKLTRETMQHFDELIRERRSIRRFALREVEQEKVSAILEAARWAPSWGNSQCWHFIVVKDQEKKEKLSKTLTKKNPATVSVKNAPLVIAVCGESNKSGFYNGQQITRYRDWLMFDLGLATQNICLMAHSLGLGSVIVGAFDHIKVEQELHVPDGFETVALLPLGYPDHTPSAPKRKDSREFVHYEQF